MLFRLREGCSWRALSIFAAHTTIYARWQQWCENGVWDKILEFLASKASGKLWAIDSTSIKVHKHAHGAPKAVGDQGIGRSRGGANTKVHALVDKKGRAVRLIPTANNRHDLVVAAQLVEGVCGRTILADKAYDSDDFRQLLGGLDLKACIPPKSNRIVDIAYHKGHYKHRHHVENFFQRLKEYRGVATRYEKLASRFMGFVTLAAICDWL